MELSFAEYETLGKYNFASTFTTVQTLKFVEANGSRHGTRAGSLKRLRGPSRTQC